MLTALGMCVAFTGPVRSAEVSLAKRSANANDGGGYRAEASPRLQQQTVSGPYCGVYSLLACLTALDFRVASEALFSPHYIGSMRGSTAGELIRAVEHCGAYGKVLTGLTVSDLNRSGRPMILHMRPSWMDRAYTHWVSFLGVEDERVRILDPPHALARVTFAELLANWDGLAVMVSDRPIDNTLVGEAWIDFALEAVVVACFACALRSLSRNPQPVVRREGWRTHCRRVALQGTGLVAIATALGVGYHVLGETGFLRNPTAIAEVVRRYYSVDIPEKSLGELRGLVDKHGCILIDARFVQDFRHGAIPGAISVPINSTLSERQRALRGVPPSSPIVVYCQSSGCRFADEIAAFLKFNGYANLAIYRGGYREWKSHG